VVKISATAFRPNSLNSNCDWYQTNRLKLLDLTADYADHADKGNIRAISDIRGQYAWAAFR
jgi:hypothetical protein